MLKHIPVLRDACIEALNIRPDGIYADATLGGAGHSVCIAEKLDRGGRLVGIDRDDTALVRAGARLEPYKERVTLIHSDFGRLNACLDEAGVKQLDGILFDLGCSSFQLDEAERGFSYMQDAPLDMRMDRDQAMTAYDLVNTADEAELRRILYTYGEEKFAPAIAGTIVRARAAEPIRTTGELSDLIRSAIPAAAARKEKQHPAKRSFQAIRIAVNHELTSIEDGLAAAIERLAPGGRIAVISFHSLEDRIVKQTFADAAKGCTCPREFPVCVCGKKPKIKVLGKPVLPDDRECEENPRARSAKLRIAEKLSD